MATAAAIHWPEPAGARRFGRGFCGHGSRPPAARQLRHGAIHHRGPAGSAGVIDAEQQHHSAQVPAVEQGQTADDERVEAFLGSWQVGDCDRAGGPGWRRVVKIVPSDRAALRVDIGTILAAALGCRDDR